MLRGVDYPPLFKHSILILSGGGGECKLLKQAIASKRSENSGIALSATGLCEQREQRQRVKKKRRVPTSAV